jgi:hypothetical protein
MQESGKEQDICQIGYKQEKKHASQYKQHRKRDKDMKSLFHDFFWDFFLLQEVDLLDMSKEANISLALSLFCQYKRIAHDLHIK